jgi:hypothetical protein
VEVDRLNARLRDIANWVAPSAGLAQGLDKEEMESGSSDEESGEEELVVDGEVSSSDEDSDSD